MPIARDLRRAGAASLDLASVAAGRLDAYYERGLQPWDHAAGALLVSEAGGVVSGAPGGHPGRAMTIAAAPGVFARLSELLDYLHARGGWPTWHSQAARDSVYPIVPFAALTAGVAAAVPPDSVPPQRPDREAPPTLPTPPR